MNPDTIANQKLFAKRGYRNIHFTGFIGDPERDWLLEHAVAYVFPSLMEGFGLPPLETMSRGTTPVVSSNTSCMPEILGDAAHYFNPLDVDNMALRIDEVLTDDKLRADLVARGLKQVQKYSWEKMAAETHAIYMQVLEGRG